MKSLYGRLAAILGSASICMMLMIGCGEQKPAEGMMHGDMNMDSMSPGSVMFTTLPQSCTISYPPDTKANKIDLSIWICSGMAPSSGTIPPNTIVNIMSMTPVPGTSGQGPIPPLPQSGITDQAVQVASVDDSTAVR